MGSYRKHHQFDSVDFLLQPAGLEGKEDVKTKMNAEIQNLVTELDDITQDLTRYFEYRAARKEMLSQILSVSSCN